MATTTPNFGWVVPTSSDLVKNGAVAIETLGDSIDASMVDLKGGTTGQVLSKTSNTDMDFTWTTASSGSAFVAGKNKIINGDFSIWQRGTSFNAATNAFTADRWDTLTDKTLASVLTTQQAFTAGAAPVAGYESQYFLRTVFPAGGSFCIQEQRVEDVRSFAGQTVTLSFWAKANATATIDPTIVQSFGTGGSANVETTTSSQTLTTSWVRYSVTATLPSISGKTIGAGNYLAVRVMRAVTASGFTIDIWGVQLEAASTATAFTTASGNSPQGELAMCQRYYFRTTSGVDYGTVGFGGIGASTTAGAGFLKYPVTMRTNPTSIDYSTLAVNDTATITAITSVTANKATPDILDFTWNCASGITQFRPYKIITNNSSAGYLGVSAEL